jgi:L-iditol 2-dehydrogenase
VTSREPSALPERMRAWVLGDPGQLSLVDKPIPMPGRAEVLVRIDAVGICATDLEIIDHGASRREHLRQTNPPPLVQGHSTGTR